MRVQIVGVVDSMKEVIRDGNIELVIYLNQPGEMIKTKCKLPGDSLKPEIGEEITLTGRVVNGVYNNRPYQFLQVD